MASGKIAYLLFFISPSYLLSVHLRTDHMHIHILGICGTFMGGLAVLAKEAGHKVTGCDANVFRR